MLEDIRGARARPRWVCGSFLQKAGEVCALAVQTWGALGQSHPSSFLCRDNRGKSIKPISASDLHHVP